MNGPAICMALAALGLAALCGGCRTGRYTFVDPQEDRVIEVKSGDRLNVDLEENATTGFMWKATCDDEDVEITYERKPANQFSPDGERLCGAPGRVVVTVRVHRGFAGPAEVRFRYMRSWSKEVAREFTFVLNHYPTDKSPWK